jgi:hypothetical protein
LLDEYGLMRELALVHDLFFVRCAARAWRTARPIRCSVGASPAP